MDHRHAALGDLAQVAQEGRQVLRRRLCLVDQGGEVVERRPEVHERRVRLAKSGREGDQDAVQRGVLVRNSAQRLVGVLGQRREVLFPRCDRAQGLRPGDKELRERALVAGDLVEELAPRRECWLEVLVAAAGALGVARVQLRLALDYVLERLARLRPEGVEELVEIDDRCRVAALDRRPVGKSGLVVRPRGDRHVAVGDPRERGGADDGGRARVEGLVDRDRDVGVPVVRQGDAVDGPDGLSGDEHLVAADELATVLEDQVIGATGAASEEDHEHEHEADEESPAGGRPRDPRPAACIHALIVSRHPCGAGCPILL